MKNMKITANSTFHNGLSQTFRVPAEAGRYPRRCPNPCDYAKDSTGVAIHCGCGWPCGRTEWEAPEGYAVHAEWATSWDNAGRNNIIIVVDCE